MDKDRLSGQKEDNMTDSLERAKAIAGLEFQKPQNEKLEAILQEYDRGEISYDEFVSKTVKEAKTSERKRNYT